VKVALRRAAPRGAGHLGEAAQSAKWVGLRTTELTSPRHLRAHDRNLLHFAGMTGDRRLHWEGCSNVRDLGGLRAADGRRTRWGALVRADAVDRLTAGGWSALEAHGVRTVIDLRNDDEVGDDAAPRPPGLSTVHLPLDGVEDVEFWDEWASGPQFGTPLYYAPFLARFPKRTAEVMSAIAGAAPGGVVFHCMGGRDRTGLISMLVLALAGVVAEDIAADYELTGGLLDEYLATRGTSAREVVLTTLGALDVEGYMRAGGLDDDDLTTLRRRLTVAASEARGHTS
jgi:protein-tyrosine phosphatase